MDSYWLPARRNRYKTGLLLSALLLVSTPGPARNTGLDARIHALEQSMEEAVQTRMIPGGVLTLVHGSRILLNRGFGLADVNRQIPVHSDSTIFRVASISKIITAMLILRAVEKNLVTFQNPVQSFSGSVRIDNPFDHPVTFFHLLTHTGGFDRYNQDLRSTDPSAFADLEATLKRRLPPVIFPPGEVFLYSNHGIALAGYAAQTVTGRPFERLAEEWILAPLGMRDSGFDPSRLDSNRFATGYRSREFPDPHPFEFTETAPSSMFMTTGLDMARLMRFLLSNEHGSQDSILSRRSISAMMERQFSNHDAFPGIGLGFMEDRINGNTVWVHGGSLNGFHAYLALDPGQSLGFFMVCNERESGYGLRDRLLPAFFPPGAPAVLYPDPESEQSADLKRYRGIYQYARSISRTTAEKINSFRGGGQFPVRTGADTLWAGETPYLECGRHLFRKAFAGGDAAPLLGFREDHRGKIRYMTTGGMDTYIRLNWHDHASLHRMILWLATRGFIVLGLISVLFLMAFFARPRLRLSSASGLMAFSVFLLCTLNLLFIQGIRHIGGPGSEGVSTAFIVLLCLPLASLAPAFLLIVLNIGRPGRLTPPIRWTGWLTTAVFLLFLFYLNNWNLLGFHFR